MNLRIAEDTVIWRRKLWIAICGGIVLEEALDLSSDRLLDDDDDDDDKKLNKVSFELQTFHMLE